MVFALAGDSTMTKDLPIALLSDDPVNGYAGSKARHI